MAKGSCGCQGKKDCLVVRAKGIVWLSGQKGLRGCHGNRNDKTIMIKRLMVSYSI